MTQTVLETVLNAVNPFYRINFGVTADSKQHVNLSPVSQEVKELLNKTALGISYRQILESINNNPVNTSRGSVLRAAIRELVKRFPDLSAQLSELRKGMTLYDTFKELFFLEDSKKVKEFLRECSSLGDAVLEMQKAGLTYNEKTTAVSPYVTSGSVGDVAYLKTTELGSRALQ